MKNLNKKKTSLKNTYNKIALSWNKLRRKPFQWVCDYLNKRKGLILIEGCGSGRHSLYASKNYNVVGLDISIKMIKLAKEKDKKSKYIVADARFLPFKKKVFDYALSIAMFHHLKPDGLIQALKELKQVVKKDCLVSVWKKKPYGEQLVKWGKVMRYYYIYSPNEFKEIVSKVFKIKKDISNEKNTILIIE